MKIKFSRELQIGILVIATIAILYFGVNYLKGINIFNPTNYYYVKLKQVNGLVASNPVTVKGYKIGLIKSINYNYDNHEDDIVVVLQVDDQLKVPVGSKAILQTELLGGASISLDLQSDVQGIYYKKGDFIPAVVDGGIMEAVTAEIMPRVQSIIPQLDSLIISLRMITENNSIEKSLGNIQRMTANLESSSVSLNSMMKNDIPVILKNVNTITTDFSKVSQNMSQVDFNATMKSLNYTSIGLLINDKSLYNNLNNTMESANNLLIDLKSNPKRYVHFSLFGKSDKK